jgi:hypothetical protein
MGRLSQAAKSRRGELVVDVMVGCILAVVAIMALIEFYGIFVKYQHVNTVARRVARTIEVTGTTEGAEDLFDDLTDIAGLDGAVLTIDASYVNGDHIQLRDTFVVTVSYVYTVRVISADALPGAVIAIPLETAYTGMSEVYVR